MSFESVHASQPGWYLLRMTVLNDWFLSLLLFPYSPNSKLRFVIVMQ